MWKLAVNTARRFLRISRADHCDTRAGARCPPLSGPAPPGRIEPPNTPNSVVNVDEIVRKFDSRSAIIGIVGLGYVSLPLVLAAANVGFSIVGVDIDLEKVDALLSRSNYIRHLPTEKSLPLIASGKIRLTANFAQLTECDAIIVRVPTPLTRQREPDLSQVKGTATSIQPHLRRGKWIAFE